MKTKTLHILFGDLADPLSKQLKDQKFKFNEVSIKVLEQAYDGLVAMETLRLTCSTILTAIEKKIVQRIVEHVQRYNPEVKVEKIGSH